MRTLSAAETVRVASGSYAPAIRVSLEDTGGVYRDVDSYYGGQRFLMGVSLQEDVDGQGPTATITLRRQVFEHSLSPLMLSSGTARGYVPSASPSPPVALYRRVKVEFYIAAVDEFVSSPSWTELFVGRIDSISVADGESVTLECRDATVAVLSDSFYERERLYGLTPAAYAYQKGCQIWARGETQAVGDICVPAKLNGYLYRVTGITTGVTGATQPNWPTVVGATVADGGVTWTCGVATASPGTVSMEAVLQQMLNDSPVSLTLYAPDATSFLMSPWKQEREPVLESMRKVAQLIGWDIRPRYDSGGTYRFQLYRPDRAASSPVRTFAPSSYVDVSALDMGIEDVRNVVRVVYGDSTDLGSDGKSPRRKYRQVSDAASISAYGRRFMEIAEEATSQIDTAAEATALANAALADLSTPYASLGVEAFFFPWTQLGDLYRFSANNVHFDSDQDLAVVGYSHEAQLGDEGEQTFRTSLTCRGKPSGGSDRWLQWDSRPGVAPTHSLQDSMGGADLTVVDAGAVVGGARFRIAEKLSRLAKWDGVELHISTTNGFAPSSATLAAYSKAETVEVGNLNPGTTYFARIVPRQLNAGRIVLGEPSEQVSFTAGFVTATKLADTAITKVFRDGAVTAVESLFRKANPTDADTLDGIPNGTAFGKVNIGSLSAGNFKTDNLVDGTYGKVLAAGLTGGQVKTDNLVDGTYGKVLAAGLDSGYVQTVKYGTGTFATTSFFRKGVDVVGTSSLADRAVTAGKLDDGISLSAYDELGPEGINARASSADGNATKEAYTGEGYVRFFTNGTGAVITVKVSTDLQNGNNSDGLTTRALVRYRLSGGWNGIDVKVTAVNTGNTAETASFAAIAADGAWHTAVADISGWATSGSGSRVQLEVAGKPNGGSSLDLSYVAVGNPGSGTGALISSRGNVGVGVASPGAKLDVSGTARASGSFEPGNSGWTSAALVGRGSWGGGVALVDGSAGFGIYVDGLGANLRIGQGAISGGLSTLVSLLSSGNVGIGTTSPSNKAHILTGNVDGLRVESSNSGFLEVGKTSAQRWRWANDYTASNVLELLTGASGAAPATSLMTVTSDGNVGIGTNSPSGAPGTKFLTVGQSGANGNVEVKDGTVTARLAVSGESIGSVGTYSNHGLRLMTNSAERVRLTNTGSVGIGIANPAALLHVSGGSIRNSALGGTGNRTVYADANGTLNTGGSDATLKTNVRALANTLRMVLGMRPVSFNWKDNERFGAQREVGFLAQELLTVVPEVIGTSADGTYTVDYSKLVSVVAGAVQELHEDRTALAHRCQTLEDRAQRAEDKLAALEARLAALEAKPGQP